MQWERRKTELFVKTSKNKSLLLVGNLSVTSEVTTTLQPKCDMLFGYVILPSNCPPVPGWAKAIWDIYQGNIFCTLVYPKKRKA